VDVSLGTKKQTRVICILKSVSQCGLIKCRNGQEILSFSSIFLSDMSCLSSLYHFFDDSGRSILPERTSFGSWCFDDQGRETF
jgi:hypothetical protein